MITSEYLKENKEIIKRLHEIPALDNVGEEELRGLLKLSEVRHFKAGETIFEEGSYEGLVYYLVSGKVKIEKNGKDLIVLQRTGDVFGEMGVIDGSSRSASVFALTDAVCVAIDVSNLDKFAGDNRFAFRYIIFREFAEVLANRLRITTKELVKAREEIERLNLAERLLAATEELAAAKEELLRLKAGLKPTRG